MEVSDIPLPPTRFWHNILGGLCEQSRANEKRFFDHVEFFSTYCDPGLSSLGRYCAGAGLDFQVYVDLARELGYQLAKHPDVAQRYPLPN